GGSVTSSATNPTLSGDSTAGTARAAIEALGTGAVPDLLHPIPTARIDLEQMATGMALAFAGGESSGLFADAMARAPVCPSTWEPKSFAKDLFLEEFAARCFRIRIDGHEATLCRSHLVNVLAHPPRDARVTEYRRQILRELADSPTYR